MRDMSLYSAITAAVVICLASALTGFCWPDGMFKRSAIAVIAALALPFIVAFAATPFLGEGAGMGVAFILYALSAIVLLAAISASAGAAVRFVWGALQDSD
jgi:hypothetical protein